MDDLALSVLTSVSQLFSDYLVFVLNPFPSLTPQTDHPLCLHLKFSFFFLLTSPLSFQTIPLILFCQFIISFCPAFILPHLLYFAFAFLIASTLLHISF